MILIYFHDPMKNQWSFCYNHRFWLGMKAETWSMRVHLGCVCGDWNLINGLYCKPPTENSSYRVHGAKLKWQCFKFRTPILSWRAKCTLFFFSKISKWVWLSAVQVGYIYIYTCIYTYIHTYIHTYILTYIHTYTFWVNVDYPFLEVHFSAGPTLLSIQGATWRRHFHLTRVRRCWRQKHSPSGRHDLGKNHPLSSSIVPYQFPKNLLSTPLNTEETLEPGRGRKAWRCMARLVAGVVWG